MTTAALLLDLKQHLTDGIARQYSLPAPEFALTPPTDRSKADFVTNVAFSLAKQVGKAPLAIAEELVHILMDSPSHDYFSASAAAPGFINIRATDAFWRALVEELEDPAQEYGNNTQLAGQRWVVEHTSPNPNKAMHIGHLRNNLIGMAIANILEASGATVIRDMVDNNRGIAIAKAMYGFLVHERKDSSLPATIAAWHAQKEGWYTPAERGQKPDHFVGACYLQGAEDYKQDPAAMEMTKQMVIDWEAEEPLTWELWKHILEYVYTGMHATLDRLGSRFDQVWHEHEHYRQGKALVEEGLEKGVFVRLPDGAVLTQLETYNLPDTIVVKSDGTSLYITQDLALTKAKKETYHADRLLWVIGPEQSTALAQVFAVCEQLGIAPRESFTHISYGLVNITDAEGNVKKMSSRGDEVLLIDDLIEQVRTTLAATDRGYDPATLESMAISAIKYGILRTGRTSNVTLNLESAVSMEGDSGVYILYALGRMYSLLGKQPIEEKATSWEFTEAERAVLAEIAYFPHTLSQAVREFAPNLLIDFVLKLSQSFNSLYGAERFVTEDPGATNRKLRLTRAAARVYAHALRLVGMTPLERV